MKSLLFPNIFSSAKTNIIEDHEATLSNLKLILSSNKNSLYGDPYFGNNLNLVLFQLNYGILADLVIDDIYTTILIFMPLLKLSRNDIKVTHDGTNIYATIKATNIIDYTTDMYTINLTDTSNT